MKKQPLWLILSYLMVAVLLLVSCTPAVTEDKEVVPEKEVTPPPSTLLFSHPALQPPSTLVVNYHLSARAT